MNELLSRYILNDGEILALQFNLSYQLPASASARQATVELLVRKKLAAGKWQPCQVRLQFQQIQRLTISEDFSSVYYSDIVLKQLETGAWYLSLDPYGNTGELHDQDNLAIVARELIVTELQQIS